MFDFRALAFLCVLNMASSLRDQECYRQKMSVKLLLVSPRLGRIFTT